MRILEIDIRSHFHAPLATLLTSPAVPPAAKKMRLLPARRLDGWTVVFLVITAATSLTGFGFPFEHLLPSHIVGAISLLVLAAAIVARYPRHLVGGWARVYAIGAVVALYLNVFVLVVQAFLKSPALNALAPTQSEPPFLVVQLVVLMLFVGFGIVAARRFGDPV